jgi:asparagine synthase (glutamine-hydrolysing)
MCGIAGFWANGWTAEPVESVLHRMADKLRHRGPDGEGYWIGGDGAPALAHRRLSVLDLSPAGAQPMHACSGRYVLVYNGEIYNHLALRNDLAAAGAAPPWRGHADTETLLAAIEHWGIEGALDRIIGMFAFALWDARLGCLHLVRDRLGEKPLYYGSVGRTLVFASELKAIEAFPGFPGELDRHAIAAYLRFGYVPAPRSIWQGIRKLPPGTILSLPSAATTGDAAPRPYWSLAATTKRRRPPIGREAAADGLEHLLGEVVRSQMLSDVPLGVFLSGGIDSSLVAALMRQHASGPVRSFSIGFTDPRLDESAHARAVATHLGTAHTEFTVTSQEALEVVDGLPHVYDEPFADSSQIPSILLSRLTRAEVTVALSGDGGDEMFAGYNRHIFAARLWNGAARLPGSARRGLAVLSSALQRLTTGQRMAALKRLSARSGLPLTTFDRLAKFGDAIGRSDDFAAFYDRLVATWYDPGEVADLSLLPRGAATLDGLALSEPVEWMMAVDTLTYLPDDIMVKVDRASMAASLETRAPFLDQRVVEAAWSLPLDVKLCGRSGKQVLKDILARHVPQALIDRPKQGFAIPLDEWLRCELRDWASTLLSAESLAGTGFWRVPAITALWQRHLSGTENAGARLWAILQFQSWLVARA